MCMSQVDYPIAISCIADDRYAMHAAVMLHSAISNVNTSTSTYTHVYVVDAGINSDNKNRLHQVLDKYKVQLHWIEYDRSLISNIPVPEWQNPVSYYKLFIPSYLNRKHERLLYLDVDMVVQSDISKLWSNDLQGNVLGAVVDESRPTVGDRPRQTPEYYRQVGIPAKTPYFNSGLMLIDVAAWCEKEIADRALKARRKAGKAVSHGDQDGLNLVVQGAWRQIDVRWNTLVSQVGKNRERVQRAHIIHYAGVDPSSSSFQHPARKQFLAALRASGWFSKIGYQYWLSKQSAERMVCQLKNITRPYRHGVGLRSRIQ